MRDRGSRLCEAHSVSCEAARALVLARGEGSRRIGKIVWTELDAHRPLSGVALDEVHHCEQIASEEYGVCVSQPVTSKAEMMLAQVECLLGCLELSGCGCAVIAPGKDPGTERIFEVQQVLPTDHSRRIPSMRVAYFPKLMRREVVMASNRGAGVRQVPILRGPRLDVGSLPNRRAGALSITAASAFDTDAIDPFLARAWVRRHPPDHTFRAGRAAADFIEVQRRPGFWAKSMRKGFVGQEAGVR